MVWTDLTSPSLCAGAEAGFSEAIFRLPHCTKSLEQEPLTGLNDQNGLSLQETDWRRQEAEWKQQEASLRQQVQHAGSLQQEKQHLQQEKQHIQRENEQLQQEISRLKRYILMLSSLQSSPLQHPTATGTQLRCGM